MLWNCLRFTYFYIVISIVKIYIQDIEGHVVGSLRTEIETLKWFLDEIVYLSQNVRKSVKTSCCISLVKKNVGAGILVVSQVSACLAYT
jgi:hypothetical protein